MKKLLGLALVALMAGGAFAQAPEVGMFFSSTEFTQDMTNFDSIGAPFNGYIVCFSFDNVGSVGGYEVGINVPAALFLLTVGGPNGWTNFGSPTNQICGYGFPLPAPAEGVVLCTINMLYTGGPAPGVIEFHGSSPASIPGHDGVVIANGENPDELIACWLVTGQINGVVASVNGDGVVAVEDHTWTSVKNLFD
jgi:hypothetical protein